MNAHSKIKIAAFDGSTVKARSVPSTIDGIHDELAARRVTRGICAVAQRAIEGVVKDDRTTAERPGRSSNV